MLCLFVLFNLFQTQGYIIKFYGNIPIRDDLMESITDIFHKLIRSPKDNQELASLSNIITLQVQKLTDINIANRITHHGHNSGSKKVGKLNEWPLDFDPNDRLSLPPILFEDLEGDIKDKLRFLRYTRDFRSVIESLDEIHYKNHGTKYPNFLIGRYFESMAVTYRVKIKSYAGKHHLTFWGKINDYNYKNYREGCYPGSRPDQPHIIEDDLDFIDGMTGTSRIYVVELMNSTIRRSVNDEDFKYYNNHSMPYPDHEIDGYYQNVARSFDMSIQTYGGNSIKEYWRTWNSTTTELN